MNCPQCTTLMVKARATSFGEEYDYCRSCKKELVEIRAAMTPTETPYVPTASGVDAFVGKHTPVPVQWNSTGQTPPAPPLPSLTPKQWGVDIHRLRAGMSVAHEHAPYETLCVDAIDYQLNLVCCMIITTGKRGWVSPKHLAII